MDRATRKLIVSKYYDYFNQNNDIDNSWNEVIEKTLEWMGENYFDIAKDKFYKDLSETQLCFKYYIRKTTLYNWINEMLEFTLLVGLDSDLIAIDYQSKILHII